jgi:hypothetical protein
MRTFPEVPTAVVIASNCAFRSVATYPSAISRQTSGSRPSCSDGLLGLVLHHRFADARGAHVGTDVVVDLEHLADIRPVAAVQQPGRAVDDTNLHALLQIAMVMSTEAAQSQAASVWDQVAEFWKNLTAFGSTVTAPVRTSARNATWSLPKAYSLLRSKRMPPAMRSFSADISPK